MFLSLLTLFAGLLILRLGLVILVDYLAVGGLWVDPEVADVFAAQAVPARGPAKVLHMTFGRHRWL